MKRLSDLNGLDVYTDTAKPLGKVCDLIVDLQKGEVARITLQPIGSSLSESKQWFEQNTLQYNKVVSVGDIIVVSDKSRPVETELPEPSQQPHRGMLGQRLHGRV